MYAGLLTAVLLTAVITDALKDGLGFPRPDFYARCFGSPTATPVNFVKHSYCQSWIFCWVNFHENCHTALIHSYTSLTLLNCVIIFLNRIMTQRETSFVLIQPLWWRRRTRVSQVDTLHVCSPLSKQWNLKHVIRSLHCWLLWTLISLAIRTEIWLGEITPSYILHTRAFGTYLLGGLFTLQKIL
jgi:hypothetical protein